MRKQDSTLSEERNNMPHKPTRDVADLGQSEHDPS
jgi:hypothetical protein